MKEFCETVVKCAGSTRKRTALRRDDLKEKKLRRNIPTEFRYNDLVAVLLAKISAVSRKLVQPKRTIKQNLLRGKMSISTSE